MPVISRFLGITIKMYLRQKEHNPPHIHAICGDTVGMFLLSNGEMFEGDMSGKNQILVKEFIEYYKDNLMKMWESQQFEMLPPLKC